MGKAREVIVVMLAFTALLVVAPTAWAAVDKVICVPWQGDVNRQHTAIAASGIGGPVPDSITFEIMNTECGYAGHWDFSLNGTLLGTVATSATCSCSPGLQSFTVSDTALLSSAWQTSADNTLRAALTGQTYYSWVRAQIVTGGSTKTVCMDDYNGGSCTELDLCSASYRNGPVDVSKSAAGDQPMAQLKGVIKTTNAASIFYKWVFGDGSESAVTTLSGATKYNVETSHTYTGAIGTPYTAQLLVADNDAMANAISDAYLMRIETDNLDSRINIAIDQGLWWLYKQANVLGGYAAYPHTYDGSPYMVWMQTNYAFTLATPTASAVHAFGINGHKFHGNPDQDPYVEAVRNGLNYLVNGYNYYTTYPALQAVAISPATTHPADNPDTNGNGYGIQVYDWGATHTPYQSGQIMDAIIASGVAPSDLTGRDFAPGTSQSHNWTYGELLQDMADMHAWGQSESTGCNSGICGSWWYGWNSGFPGDNSASQWGAIGLIPAQQPPWNVVVPQWVKTYNANWLAYSMGCSGPSSAVTSCTYNYFSYNGVSGCAGDSCLQTTTSGMVQMILDGQTTSDLKWSRASRRIADLWQNFTHVGSDWGGWKTYGWYSFAKAMRLSLPNPTTHLLKSSSASFDWYYGNPGNATCSIEANCEQGLAPRILETQTANGANLGAWESGNLTNSPLTTAWMIITLKPTLFEASPSACFTAQPNPSFADQDIFFNPFCSSPPNEPGKQVVLYEWDWNNDGVYDQSTGTPDIVTHQFACAVLPCAYPVKLRVTDNSTPPRTATTVLDINITNPPHPPVANANGPYVTSRCSNDSLRLDGSNSFDPDEGLHQAGCATCPNDAITAWDWDLVPPLDFGAVNRTGEIVTLGSSEMSGFFGSPGVYDIGLRVADNTALSYPGSGNPAVNLTNAAFTTVDMKAGCICNLAARSKLSKIQLTWTHTGAASYDIYRSTVGPNTAFTLIADDHVTTYATYLDSGVVLGTRYWYRVVSNGGNCAGGSNASTAVPTTR